MAGDLQRGGFARTFGMLLLRWRIQAYMDLMWMTRDAKLCLINVVSDVILNLLGVMAVFLLAERFDGIGVSTREQTIFMLGYAALVRGILVAGFGYNILQISRRVGRGQMDHVLIQPQPIWMILLTEGFMPFSGCLSLFTGIGITAWSLTQLSIPFVAGWGFWFFGHLVASTTIVLAISFFWGSLAFWSPVGAEEISSQATRLIFQLKSFPLDGLGPLLQNVLLTVLPVGFVAWYPSQTLMGIGDHSLWMTPFVAILVSLLAFVAFKKGLKHYEQTGSQRYVGWAHRS